MEGDWILDGAALRACRVAKKLSVAKLAKKSGIGERTLWRYEKGNVEVEADVVACLAKPLGVLPTDIARPPARVVRDPRVPKPSTLERFAERDVARGPAPPVVVAGKRHRRVGAKVLQDLFTAPAVYEGELLAVVGEVRAQHHATIAEAKLLGARRGVCARFHLFVEVPGGDTIGVTVHAKTTAETKAMQALQGCGEATLLARVLVASGEPEEGAPGFSFFMTAGVRPWALVVERVIAAGAIE